MWVAVGLLAGGALGNLADRVRNGAVTDFIDLPLWPAFNLADMAITGGVALLACLYLRERRTLAERAADRPPGHELAVIDKPAGLVVHPAPSHPGPTLVDVLGDLLGGGADPERPGDRPPPRQGHQRADGRGPQRRGAPRRSRRRSSAARSSASTWHWSSGRLGSRTGTIDAPIGRASRQRHLMAVAGSSPRQARTHFEVAETLAADTLLEAASRPGAPTRSVPTSPRSATRWSATRLRRAGRYGLERQFLHAHRLGFAHPSTGERLSFGSELPPDLAGALELARRA